MLGSSLDAFMLSLSLTTLEVGNTCHWTAAKTKVQKQHLSAQGHRENNIFFLLHCIVGHRDKGLINRHKRE